MTSTPLPILVPNLPQQRFSCHSCTNCCRDIVVHLTRNDLEKIDAQGWSQRLDVPPYVRLGGKWVLNQRRDHRCVFLQDDGRCRIHAEHGATAKPIGCQLFPFVLVPSEGGWQLSYRFDCPTLAASKGSSISEHLPALKRLAAALPHPNESPQQAKDDVRRARFAGLQFQPGRSMKEQEALCFIDLLDDWLKPESRPLEVRLLGLIRMVEYLSQIDARRIEGERFTELLKLLFGALEAEVGDVGADPPPPTTRQRKLLRQQVFTHCEAISMSDALAGWPVRTARMLSQLRRSRQFLKLGGQAPRSIVTSKRIAFATIEAVQPARQEASPVRELLIRYLRAQILSRSFFGAAYYGWDAVTGLQALLSRLAVWGRVARHCAAAEDRTEIDYGSAIRGIGIVARAAGVSRALGSQTERLRLTYLQMDHGLERLLRAYPLTA